MRDPTRIRPNQRKYVRYCKELSSRFLNLAVEYKTLKNSIKQHGITKETANFIQKRHEKLEEIFKGE